MQCTVKKTVEQIVKSENHYCIGLKGNQKNLLQSAQPLSQVARPLSEWQETDSAHGRLVQRSVRVFAAPLELRQQWSGLATVVAVERQGVRDGHLFHSQAWFILS